MKISATKNFYLPEDAIEILVDEHNKTNKSMSRIVTELIRGLR